MKPRLLIAALLSFGTATSAGAADQFYDVTAYGVTADGFEHSGQLGALIAAFPSATLYFPCGTYLLNNFTIANAINLKGASRSCVTLRQADDSQQSFITVPSSDVGLSDLTLQIAPHTGVGVDYLGAQNYTLERITVTGAQTSGVYFSNASNVHVRGSRFAGNGRHQFLYELAPGSTASGIYIDTSEFDATGVAAPFVVLYIGTVPSSSGSLRDIFVTNNKVTGRSTGATESDGIVLANGITVADSMSHVVVTGNSIVNDTASGTATYGIELASTTDNTVTGNTIVNFQKGILLEYAAGATAPLTPAGTVSGNVIRPNPAAPGGGTGIYIVNGRWTVTGNMITAPGYNLGYGIAILDKLNVVTGNSIYVSDGVGINIQANDLVVNDNIILGPTSGVGQGIKIADNPRTNVQMRNNHITNVFYGIYAVSTTFTNVIATGNSFSGVSKPFWGNYANPGFFRTDDSSGKMLSLSGNLQLKAVTVSGLGVCNAAGEGTQGSVTDATAPSYGAQLIGGGAVHIGAYCNGTMWIAR